jgi:hypothetical protein
MQSIQLSKGKKRFDTVSFPQSWNELDRAELLLVARQLLSTGADDIAGKVQIFIGLLRNRVQKDKFKLPNDCEALLSIEDTATDGLDAVSFIYSSNNLTRQPFFQNCFLLSYSLYDRWPGGRFQQYNLRRV